MRRLFIFLPIVAFVAAQNGNFPEKLFCNRLYGNYITCCDKVNLGFGRPMELGDKIIINGTVGPAAGFYFVRINIRDPTGNVIPFRMRTMIKTDWPYNSKQLIYNSLIGKFGKLEYGPNPYAFNTPMQITIHYTAAGWYIYSGTTLIKTFGLRHSMATPLMYLELNGQYTTNWVQMDCVNPPPTTAAPTTTRRRGSGHEHGHGDGHGGHHHHHHHGKYDSSSSSSSSSSQELCDD